MYMQMNGLLFIHINSYLCDVENDKFMSFINNYYRGLNLLYFEVK